jgi:cytosine/adenosine deaminase-related metal-dependent hydrolase
MLLRARLILPIAQPPIADGAVSLAGPIIDAVGPWPNLAKTHPGPVMDLGECILLPGLINCHCHLDYTRLAGQIPPPRSFADWIKALVALKGTWHQADFAQSWLTGAQMLLRTGTTTVVDIEAAPELVPDMWRATPLRVISFRELIGLKPAPAANAAVETAVQEWAGLPEAEERVGLSPHAPYSTTPELLQLAARAARERGWRLTTHVAESEQELEMFLYRHGPLYDWLKSQRDMSDCGLGSPIQSLERAGYLGPDVLAVHVNYLWRGDADRLGRRQMSVVHCPRSHDYFRHLRFPMQELKRAGVNLVLGTDSLASVRRNAQESVELDLFAEMRALAWASPDLSPATILSMVTVNAARALGRLGQIGELSRGALADLIAIPFLGKSSALYEAVLHHTGPVQASMINGEWAVAPRG